MAFKTQTIFYDADDPKFRWIVIVDDERGWFYGLENEVSDWCKQHLNSGSYLAVYYQVQFKSEADAMLFYLSHS